MSWLSLLPPVLAIVLAIWKREVILALPVAIFAAETPLHDHCSPISDSTILASLAAGGVALLLFTLAGL